MGFHGQHTSQLDESLGEFGTAKSRAFYALLDPGAANLAAHLNSQLSLLDRKLYPGVDVPALRDIFREHIIQVHGMTKQVKLDAQITEASSNRQSPLLLVG